jgi:hypothetical protein
MDKQPVWIDPPSGWRYGFPKIWNPNTDSDMHKWLVDNGYPEIEITSMGEYFFIRAWDATEEELDGQG